MPQRFLRPGITNSERWNSVDALCQSFYIRILTRVDDYGRCDGRASVLLGECWSVWNERHPEEQIDLPAVRRMLQQLAAERLIELYEASGKTVLAITQWQERVREGSKEKWPANTNPQQSAATCSETLPPPPPPSPPPSTTNQPSGSYPSLEEVKAYGERIGCLPAEAERFWNHFEASGWIDKNGHPVLKWQNKLSTWNTGSRSRGPESVHNSNGETKKLPSVFELTKKMEAQEREAAKIKNAYSSDAAMDTNWSNEKKRKEWVELRKSISSLNKQIANYG